MMYKCDICNKTNLDEDDTLLYGEWMIKQNITVHYYCLLLSTNLPQRGGDASGILGFLLRDIRQEAAAAQQRKCIFCNLQGASVFCFKCRIVFHVVCGLENHCISQFCDEFRSYCDNCAPLDDYKRQLLKNPPTNVLCDICFRAISPFFLQNVAYGDCCRKGFVHKSCMRRYALASGYYLRCLWCRKKKFQDMIKLQSVFVPNRDATWERQPNAYRELHTKRLRCEQSICLCPSGRDFNRCSWIIQLCILCAATGTHLKCLDDNLRLSTVLGTKSNNFKCNFCLEVEHKLKKDQGKLCLSKTSWETADEHIDTSFYMYKKNCELSIASDDDSFMTSDDNNSIITVVPSQRSTLARSRRDNFPAMESVTPIDVAAPSIIDLSETPPLLLSALQLKEFLLPPLLLQETFICQNHFYLIVYEYNEQLPEGCTGSCTLRFPLEDERLKDRSVDTLQQLQVTHADIWLRDNNRGIYDKIDMYTK